jgi:hypothetical protein
VSCPEIGLHLKIKKDMTKRKKTTIRYSNCFKLQVVEEIEKNGLSIEECRRKYDIRGGATIQSWLRLFGKQYLMNKMYDKCVNFFQDKTSSHFASFNARR